MTTLSLQLDDGLYEQVQAYSDSHNINLNEVVSHFFQQLVNCESLSESLDIPSVWTIDDDEAKAINKAIDNENQANIEIAKLLKVGDSLV